jgi:Patatin-like phospholipase
MANEGQSNHVFRIGLTMAGAISAGAYTAGVLDVLIEALNAWYAKKAAEKDAAPESRTVPSHDVNIDVIAGASAGGVCGALLPAAMLEALPATSATYEELGNFPIRIGLPRLFRAWVTRARMTAPSGSAFLTTDDLDPVGGKTPRVQSALNCKLLDQIAIEALTVDAGVATHRYPYLSEKLHIILTLTNLRGVPYEIGFTGGGAIKGHGMLLHGEIAHFVDAGIGTRAYESPWAKTDKNATEVDSSLLPGAGLGQPNWPVFITAALATAAFPIGLAPRALTRKTDDWNTRLWPLETGGNAILPAWPANAGGMTSYDYGYVNVDGGTIDNEPFEYARWGIRDASAGFGEAFTNERNALRADRAVLMIDPFPEPPSFDPDKALEARLTTTLKKILPTFINQARFKPQELVTALREDVFSRFLVLPRRTKIDGALEDFGIACGLLGGFGGFFYEPFRAHDYQLGRRNCQRFLENAFALPVGNPIFAADDPEAVRAASYTTDGLLYSDAEHPTPQRFQQIIPLVGLLKENAERQPNWPRMPETDFNALMAAVEARMSAVVPALLKEQFTNRLYSMVLRVLWVAIGKSKLLDYARATIRQDLIRRDQLESYKGIGDQIDRDILSALSDPAFEARQLPGLAKAFTTKGYTAAAIEAVLVKHGNLVWSGTLPGVAGICYTLEERAPSVIRSWPVLGNVTNWLNAPAVDRGDAA